MSIRAENRTLSTSRQTWGRSEKSLMAPIRFPGRENESEQQWAVVSISNQHNRGVGRDGEVLPPVGEGRSGSFHEKGEWV